MSAPATAIALDDAQVEAAVLLRKLDSLRDQVLALSDSHQPGRLTFVPRSTREAIGRQFRLDRKAQAAARAAGYPSTLGNTHSPGNMPAWALAAEIETTLVDVRRRILTAHELRGTCAIPRRVYHRVTRDNLFPIVRELIFSMPTVVLARVVNRDLQHLVEEAERLIEGDERTELDAQCPHCRRPTLVVYLRAGRISCERPRDRATGRRARCQCSDPLCGCRTDPAGHVHSWYRDRPASAPDSWEALSSRLNLRNLARKKDRP